MRLSTAVRVELRSGRAERLDRWGPEELFEAIKAEIMARAHGWGLENDFILGPLGVTDEGRGVLNWIVRLSLKNEADYKLRFEVPGGLPAKEVVDRWAFDQGQQLWEHIREWLRKDPA